MSRRKSVFAICLLVLMMGSFSATTTLHLEPTQIRPNEGMFIPSAEGDESSESITSFNETTANDQMYSLGPLGWQHDCSTMTNVTEFSGTVTSDGDKVSIKVWVIGSNNCF